MRFRMTAALCVLVLAACDSGLPPPPVIVYAPADMEDELRSWLADSGFAVTVIPGIGTDYIHTIINKQDAPRADVVVTSSVVDIWRVGDHGRLRPLQGDAFARVPAQLKDPDGTWVAFDYRYAVIAAGPNANEALPRSYADLGTPELAGQVCLSSSALSANRVVISMMIEELGLKPAERAVRRWAHNLAQPPFATEAELIAALEAGDCNFGIVTGQGTTESVLRLRPTPVYVDIDAVGVSRHAQNAEAAQQLVDWMLSDRALGEPSETNGRNVGVAGWHDEDARLLVERAGYR